jgi:hypothetical protein
VVILLLIRVLVVEVGPGVLVVPEVLGLPVA